MALSLYLLIGFLIPLPLSWKPNLFWQILLAGHWSGILLWSLEIFQWFSYKPVIWSKLLNLSFDYHIDGLARIFSLLISGIGILIFIYTSFYNKGFDRKNAKMLSLLQLFAVSMLCLVLVDNLLVLFIAWELTSVTSYLLIQFDSTDKATNRAAFNSLFISVAGSLAMLVGLILLHQLAGTWSIQKILLLLQNSTNLNSSFCLLLLGAITKSALFPFYFWLVGAMKAPTPVSAYLHSATMVNAGIYLLARFHPLFSNLSLWYPSIAFFGLSTMLVSSLLSLFQKDLKAILAYTTLFALGSMVYLLATRYWPAAQAFALFLLFHGLYKAAAFMWVGAIDKSYGTRNIYELQGLGKQTFGASVVAVIAFSAMAGIPPFFGFILKEMIYEAKLAGGAVSFLSLLVSILSSMFIAAVSFKCLYYWFKGQTKLRKKHNMGLGLFSPLILVLIILALEFLLPHLSSLMNKTANSIIWSSQESQCLKNEYITTLLSFLAIIGGILIFFVGQWAARFNLHWPIYLNPRFLFEQALEKLIRFGAYFTSKTQEESLSKQLVIILFTLIIWMCGSIYAVRSLLPSIHWIQSSLPVQALSLLLICIGASILFKSNFLMNMISFALLGLTLSSLFILQGAPDVAMTQLLVEILMVIILVIALRRAQFEKIGLTLKQKVSNGCIAGLCGLAVSFMLFLVTSTPFDEKISDYFIQNTPALTHGRNIVNIILVDFRAFDTLGESLVVLASSLAIYLLIDKSRQTKEKNKQEA